MTKIMKGNIMFPYTKNYFNDIENVIKIGNDFSKMAGNTVLITGCTGLIGSAVVDLLICLNERYGLSIEIVLATRNIKKLEQRFLNYLEKDYINIVPYDAEKEITFHVKKIDYIIHAAGNSHPSVFEKEPVETMKANFLGLLNLLEYIKECNEGRLIYISSSEIYGVFQLGHKQPYLEDEYGYIDILNPRSCYPSSKRASETLLVSYIKEYGIDANVVRPGHIYGPTQTSSDSRASAQFLNNVLSGESITMKSSGMQMRSYCHCMDCASAILTVALNGERGEAYNISNPKSLSSIRNFAQICSREAGREVIYEMPTDSEVKSYNQMTFSALDCAKLERLGWKAFYNLEDGIKESIKILENKK